MAGLSDGNAGRSAAAGCAPAPCFGGRDHPHRQGLRVPGAVHQHARLSRGHPAERGDQGGQSEDQDRIRGTARLGAAGEEPERSQGSRLRGPPRIRLRGHRFCQRQAAGGDCRGFVPQERQGGPQPGRTPDQRSRFPAQRDRRLQAGLGRAALQRSLPAASVRVAVHDPRLSGAVHVLPVAADVERASLAQAVERRGGARDGAGQGILALRERILLRRRHLQHSESADHRAVRQAASR